MVRSGTPAVCRMQVKRIQRQRAECGLIADVRPRVFSKILDISWEPLMIVVDTRDEVNPKETKAQLTTTAGALDMRGFD